MGVLPRFKPSNCNKKAIELQKKKKNCAEYGDPVTNRMCQKCFVKFYTGDFSLDDAPWSARLVEVDSYK